MHGIIIFFFFLWTVGYKWKGFGSRELSHFRQSSSSCLQMEPPKDTADKLVVPVRSMFMKEQNIGQQSSERGKEFENCMNIKVRKEGRRGR